MSFLISDFYLESKQAVKKYFYAKNLAKVIWIFFSKIPLGAVISCTTLRKNYFCEQQHHLRFFDVETRAI